MIDGTFTFVKASPVTGYLEEYDISYGELGYLESISGLHLGPLHRLRERGPFQDGETDLGYRLDSRDVQLVLLVTGDCPARLDEKLEWLAAIVGPDDRGFSLRRYRPDDTKRQIDLHLAGPSAAPSDDATTGDRYSQRVGLTCDAPAPNWYDPALNTVSFGISASAGGSWDIPWAIPWNIGNSTLDQSVNVVYSGTATEYPVLIVDGPITNLVITNGGLKLDFTGTTISAGQRWTIDLRYGAKTIVDQSGVNKIASLTNDSNLDTWRLLSTREVANGLNPIRVTGSAATTATQIYMQYYTRYLNG